MKRVERQLEGRLLYTPRVSELGALPVVADVSTMAVADVLMIMAATVLAAEPAEFCAADPRVIADTSHPLVRLKDWQLKESERDRPNTWHSDFGQDKYVRELFGGKRGGFFIDLAANNPIHSSNSRALERDYGWSGLCIEPNPYYHAPLAKKRSCRLVVCAVSETEGMAKFHFNGPSGGLIEGNTDNQQRVGGKASAKLGSIQTMRFATILQRLSAPTEIDYLSLDVEGAESLVMSSFPWATHRIRVLSIERPKPGLVRELQQHQYGYHCSLGRAAWHDEIWVHRPSMPDVQTSRHPMPSQARPCGQNVSAPVLEVLASHPARARKGSARAIHTAYAGAEEKEKAGRVRTDAQRVDALIDLI